MKYPLVRHIFFFGFLGAITLATFWMLGGFAMPIVWAIVLSIVCMPVYTKLLKIGKGRKNIAAFITLLLVIGMFFIPIYFVGTLVGKEAVDVYSQLNIDSSTAQSKMLAYSESIAKIADNLGIAVTSTDIQTKFIEVGKTVSASIAVGALEIGRATTGLIIKSLLVLYLLFFALRDGKKFRKKIIEILPLGDTREKTLMKKFASIVHAIFKGTLIIALVQGILGGLTLWLVGMDNVLLWATVMTILAVIPALGPTIVLAPIAAFLLITGSIGPAIIVLIGLGIVSVTDNLLRPALMGRDMQMHDVFITLSVFGGLAVFGISGFILGPVIMGLFITLWEMFEEEYNKS